METVDGSKLRQLTSENERKTLTEIARGHCLEIGSYDGGSALAILRSTAVDQLHCVDPFVNYGGDGITPNLKYFLANAQPYIEKSRLVLHYGKSEDILHWIRDSAFHFIFIDGNHGFESVITDWDNSLRLIKKGGIIALHDYTATPGTQWAAKQMDYTLEDIQTVDWLKFGRYNG